MAKKRILALDPGGTLPADRGAVRGTRTARDLAIRRAGEGAWVMEVTRSGEDLSRLPRKVLLESKRVGIGL